MRNGVYTTILDNFWDNFLSSSHYVLALYCSSPKRRGKKRYS